METQYSIIPIEERSGVEFEFGFVFRLDTAYAIRYLLGANANMRPNESLAS